MIEDQLKDIELLLTKQQEFLEAIAEKLNIKWKTNQYGGIEIVEE